MKIVQSNWQSYGSTFFKCQGVVSFWSVFVFVLNEKKVKWRSSEVEKRLNHVFWSSAWGGSTCPNAPTAPAGSPNAGRTPTRSARATSGTARATWGPSSTWLLRPTPASANGSTAWSYPSSWGTTSGPPAWPSSAGKEHTPNLTFLKFLSHFSGGEVTQRTT